jgi:hypothetical protein
MKPQSPVPFAQWQKRNRILSKRSISLLIASLVLTFLLGTGGFQTYWSKERRLIAAADEIVTALKAYRDASPGTAKEFPLELADLKRDPRMLSEKLYLGDFPLDPITMTQEWGILRNKEIRVIGVRSLSNDSPTLFAKIFSFRGGEKYSDWKFLAE